ncbi:unnamed protein product [Acanthoscelides obtectus]|uniref:Uncharacterized protein n=1 Tax=Acanthoscelides obtectus TaxID=200917 RepID=A0A9P0PBA1_ACAOB|nr:unnamed protein product [Acanthoscelides obtectus]CAK1641693.1 hypothetical protein AOBTE_LOCUS12563 [Acanthoscelides obtectus]
MSCVIIPTACSLLHKLRRTKACLIPLDLFHPDLKLNCQQIFPKQALSGSENGWKLTIQGKTHFVKSESVGLQNN